MIIIGVSSQYRRARLLLLGTFQACRPCAAVFRWRHSGDLFNSSWSRTVRRHCHRFCCCRAHTCGRSIRFLGRALTPCPPCHWAAVCSSRGPRRLRCDLQPCPHRCSLGMVAGGVRRVGLHHRRWYRLGARVDPDRAHSERGRCTRPSSAADWGYGQGQVTQ